MIHPPYAATCPKGTVLTGIRQHLVLYHGMSVRAWDGSDPRCGCSMSGIYFSDALANGKVMVANTLKSGTRMVSAPPGVAVAAIVRRLYCHGVNGRGSAVASATVRNSGAIIVAMPSAKRCPGGGRTVSSTPFASVNVVGAAHRSWTPGLAVRSLSSSSVSTTTYWFSASDRTPRRLGCGPPLWMPRWASRWQNSRTLTRCPLPQIHLPQ